MWTMHISVLMMQEITVGEKWKHFLEKPVMTRRDVSCFSHPLDKYVELSWVLEGIFSASPPLIL